MRKYFATKAEARKALAERKDKHNYCDDDIFRMPKGTRHAGQYAVCSHLEFINTY